MKAKKQFKSIKIIESGKAIKCQLKNGDELRYHSQWLRDNALDSETRDSNNGQKLINHINFSDNYIETVSLDKLGENISLTFYPEKKQIKFSSNWLVDHAYDLNKEIKTAWVNSDLKTWNKKSFTKKFPEIDYMKAKSNKSLLYNWLSSIKIYGFAKMSNCGLESGAIVNIAKLFGYIRETNYGKLFNVKTNVNAINLAYTNLGLSPHTDNPYRDPIPTIQILHCLENSVNGGDSIVVDGFYAAQLLQKQNPYYFKLLSRYSANFEFKEKNKVYLKSKRPLIELSPSQEIITIRFNNRSIAPITDVPYKKMTDYYKAYTLFSNIINDSKLAVKFKLNPGQCFVVDNTRVLHARTAYFGKGKRWLQGCYVDKDGLLSKISTILN